MTEFAIYVELKAKPNKVREVADMLLNAREAVLLERETVAWFAVQFDATTFGIFDVFDTEAGRHAHLSGVVAAELMSRAPDLLAAPPELRLPRVLAEKMSRPPAYESGRAAR